MEAQLKEVEFETDYGVVTGDLVDYDGDSVRVALVEDTPPLGEAGDTSWIPIQDIVSDDLRLPRAEISFGNCHEAFVTLVKETLTNSMFIDVETEGQVTTIYEVGFDVED